jgi:hypothetical protein
MPPDSRADTCAGPRRADHLQVPGGRLRPLARRHALDLEPKLDVLGGGLPGEERVVLEDHAAVGSGPAHHVAVDEYRAPGGATQAGQDVEERRLPASARADDGDELVARDLEIEPADRHHLLGGLGIHVDLLEVPHHHAHHRTAALT